MPTSPRAEKEGVRRAICDMALLIFHLVLSSITFEGVDINMAQKILAYHIERYPNGMWFRSVSLCARFDRRTRHTFSVRRRHICHVTTPRSFGVWEKHSLTLC